MITYTTKLTGADAPSDKEGGKKSGVLETKINTVNQTASGHKECDIMEDALTRLQGAWENSE